MSFSIEDILRSHGLGGSNRVRIIKTNTEPIEGVSDGVFWYSPATTQTRIFIDGKFRDPSGMQNGKPVLISPNGTIFELSVTDRGQITSEDIGAVQSYEDKLILRSPSGINYEIFIDQNGILSTSATSFEPSTFTVILKTPKQKRFGLSVDDDGRIWTDQTYQSETGPWVLKAAGDETLSFEVTVDEDGALWSTVVSQKAWGVVSPSNISYLVEINEKGEIVTSQIEDTSGIDMRRRVLASPVGNYYLGVNDEGAITTERTSEVGKESFKMQAEDGTMFDISINDQAGIQTKKE